MRCLACARPREALGDSESLVDLADGARAADLWNALCDAAPALVDLSSVVRFAQNGTLTTRDAELNDGDEVALLPPVGGG